MTESNTMTFCTDPGDMPENNGWTLVGDDTKASIGACELRINDDDASDRCYWYRDTDITGTPSQEATIRAHVRIASDDAWGGSEACVMAIADSEKKARVEIMENGLVLWAEEGTSQFYEIDMTDRDHEVVLTVDPTEFTLYVDGEQILTTPGYTFPVFGTQDRIEFGASSTAYQSDSYWSFLGWNVGTAEPPSSETGTVNEIGIWEGTAYVDADGDDHGFDWADWSESVSIEVQVAVTDENEWIDGRQMEMEGDAVALELSPSYASKVVVVADPLQMDTWIIEESNALKMKMSLGGRISKIAAIVDPADSFSMIKRRSIIPVTPVIDSEGRPGG